jgi:hypothetical protein
MPDYAWHKKFRKELDDNIAKAYSLYQYEQKVRATYYVLSMLSLWIKWPKDKQTLESVKQYVRRRMNYDEAKNQETKKEQTNPSAYNL